MKEFTHLNQGGEVKMVDVSEKLPTMRTARAEGCISLSSSTLSAIQDNTIPKGNVLNTARIAGIMAAKKCSDLIPLCHQLNLSFIGLKFHISNGKISIQSTAKTRESTGVEMEALTAVSVAALTIYDMCKAVDKTMVISDIKLLEKKGGKTSHAIEYKPHVGVITLSDSVSSNLAKDGSGPILINGFTNAGCMVNHYEVLPDGSENLMQLIQFWIEEGVELILTTGGTGMGPRDLTINTVEPLLDYKLQGVESALHVWGKGKVKTAMLSRLSAGVIGKTIIICLPGSPSAVRDALQVLIPDIFHAYHMLKGEKHS
ncbi:MAG: bifunctional molybdenum cofactor biosynthesis protein MoaC/MoaB [Candidatus Marinimicrobia bacterium]|nr:bifunctional molybdenum cofactor biosynthesis protein MoaC/MoaB [Candidatus Neomarinimicrobiota bacterium]